MQLPLDPDDQALIEPLLALIYEFGDAAPRSSVTRAQRLRRESGLSAAQFLRVLDEAVRRTRARQHRVRRRRQANRHVVNAMPYLFAVLQDLLSSRTTGSDKNRVQRQRSYDETRRAEGWTDYAPHPEPPLADMDPRWRATLDELRSTMTGNNYRTWLLTTRVLGGEGDVLRIGTATEWQRMWLDAHLRPRIERVMLKTAPDTRVVFVTIDAHDTGEPCRAVQ